MGDVDFAAVGFDVAVTIGDEVELVADFRAGVVGSLAEPSVDAGPVGRDGVTVAGEDVASSAIAGEGEVPPMSPLVYYLRVL